MLTTKETFRETAKEIKNFMLGPRIRPVLSQIPTGQKLEAEFEEFIANEDAEAAARRRQAAIDMKALQEAKENNPERARLLQKREALQKAGTDAQALLAELPGKLTAVRYEIEVLDLVLQAPIDELRTIALAGSDSQNERIDQAVEEVRKVEAHVIGLTSLRLEQKVIETNKGQVISEALGYRGLKLAMLGREPNTHLGISAVQGWIPRTKTALKKLRRETSLTPEQLEAKISAIMRTKPAEAPSWYPVAY